MGFQYFSFLFFKTLYLCLNHDDLNNPYDYLKDSLIPFRFRIKYHFFNHSKMNFLKAFNGGQNLYSLFLLALFHSLNSIFILNSAFLNLLKIFHNFFLFIYHFHWNFINLILTKLSNSMSHHCGFDQFMHFLIH